MSYTPSADAIAAYNLLLSYLTDLGAPGSTQPDRVEAIFDAIKSSGLISIVTWRGAWSSGTAYAVNDLVDSGGAVYIAIAAGTGHTPASSPTYWQPLGVAGSGTVTEVDTGTGLTGGPITTIGTIALADTTVTPGSYGDSSHAVVLTIDQQGRIAVASEAAITPASIGADVSGAAAAAQTASERFSLVASSLRV